MKQMFEKLSFLYQPYVLAIVSIGYVVGELGHYLIGVTSKAIAIDLHYGDIACQLNNTEFHLNTLPFQCGTANNSETYVTKQKFSLCFSSRFSSQVCSSLYT